MNKIKYNGSMKIQLKKGVVQSVDGKAGDVQITVQSGELWLTENGRDVFLRAGDNWQLQKGAVVWESLTEESVFCLGTDSNVYRIRERHQTHRKKCSYDLGASG